MAEASQGTKVLVLGLDAMDPDLILTWCDSGDLPAFAKLRDLGAWGRLETFPGLADDAIWSSFCTGNHPGSHGRYHNFQFDPVSYNDILVRNRLLLGDPFWQTLSEAGRRVAIVDVPKCPLTPGLNGIQLADWRVHGRDGPTRSHPPDLAPQVIANYGDDQNDLFGAGTYLCSYGILSEETRNTLHDRLIVSIDQKARMLEDLLKQGSWDLFLGVFKEAHCSGHQFWQPATDKVQQGEPGDKQAKPPNRLKGVYQALDKAIGRLMGQVDDQTLVIVFSDIGMGDNFSGDTLLESVLLRLEPNLLTRAWGRVFSMGSRRHRARRLLNRVNHRLRKTRTAFQVPHNEISGAIRINLRDRENHGQISRGEPFNRLCDELETELTRLRDPVTGLPIVEQVIRTRDSFRGQGIDNLPDLLVVWNREHPISGAHSSTIGTVFSPPITHRPGNHVPGGLYLTKGPMLKPGEQVTRSSIMDLAPTITSLLGVTLPSTHGQPIQALLGPECDEQRGPASD